MIWWIILGMLISALCFIAYLIMFAPLMPDDYDLKEGDIRPKDQWSNDKDVQDFLEQQDEFENKQGE